MCRSLQGEKLGDVVHLPLDRITERDRTRLFQAVAGSPLDIDLVMNGDGAPQVLVYRCGRLHPSYRVEKAAGVWQAFDLEDGGSSTPALVFRHLSDLVAAMSYPDAQQNRPTAS